MLDAMGLPMLPTPMNPTDTAMVSSFARGRKEDQRFPLPETGPSIAPDFREVYHAPRACREHMICPLPRANEMSALQARWDRAMSNKEGAHALSRGRRGAGHETTGGHLPSLGGDADVVAGRRYFGNRPPQPETLAGALSGRRGPRAV